jgi:hypothetical protein
MALQITTPTEAAAQRFGEQVQQIARVLRIERSDDSTTGGRAFRVTVRKGDGEARYAVYRLEAEMYRQYEGARLDIRLVEEVLRA